MTNFHINLTHPWLMLLLIPALALTLIPYFRLSRKYRRTRNRISSIALHLAVMLLAVSMLSGMSFDYEKTNDENEVMLVVDLSYSTEQTKAEKDSFVQSVINDCGSKKVRVGVVTFGYDQIYAAKLTTDAKRAYNDYLNAELPDDSATDIAAALRFASEQFSQPKTAKIVLLSDGIETDDHVSSVIKSIAAEGIKVDTVYYPTETGNEIQLIGVTLPDYNVAVGDSFEVTLSAQSSIRGDVRISLYDNGELKSTEVVDILEEKQEIVFNHSFNLPGLHTLSFQVESVQDTLVQNNTYYSYMYLETFDRILVVERNQSESDKLKDLLVGNSYNVDVVNVSDKDAMPTTLEELREYDQVILMNIANADLPEGFDKVLNTYVFTIGGGLLTVGGNDETGKPNAYGRSDMIGTLYQEMLPVQAIDYTPPLAVMIIIDRSGSMSGKDSSTGKNKLELAKEGALSCLESLSSRDWCGIMTLETDYNEEIQMTPRTQIGKIRAAIDAIEIGGGTYFTGAIDRAGKALSALTNVERRHIILITDGQPGDKYDSYSVPIQNNYESSGITLSVVAIGVPSSYTTDMSNAAALGRGRFHEVKDGSFSKIPTLIREDINVPEITDYIAEPFVPKIKDHTSAVSGILQENMPELGGFYGTKVKDGADVPLSADYAPVYAQWKYGAGSVGSFMCDLNGTWSADFLASTTGIRFLNNVIAGLFPTTSVRASDIDFTFKEDNYTTNVSIFTTLEEGETIELIVTGPADATGNVTEQIIRPAVGEDYTRVSFENTIPGIYTVCGRKLAADGTVLSEQTKYKAFSYSKEYDAFSERNVAISLMQTTAEYGHGAELDVNDPWAALENFVKFLQLSYDPRYLFAILIIVLFLLDIAVRKFKFKWPHELVRDYKEKKLLRTGSEKAN